MGNTYFYTRQYPKSRQCFQKQFKVIILYALFRENKYNYLRNMFFSHSSQTFSLLGSHYLFIIIQLKNNIIISNIHLEFYNIENIVFINSYLRVLRSFFNAFIFLNKYIVFTLIVYFLFFFSIHSDHLPLPVVMGSNVIVQKIGVYV